MSFSMPYLAIAASVSPPPAMLKAFERGDGVGDRLGAARRRRRTRTRRPARSRRWCRPLRGCAASSAAVSRADVEDQVVGRDRRPRLRRVAGASAANSLAVTTSTGIGTAAPRARIASMTACASPTRPARPATCRSAGRRPAGRCWRCRRRRSAGRRSSASALQDRELGARPCSRRRSPPAAASGRRAPG